MRWLRRLLSRVFHIGHRTIDPALLVARARWVKVDRRIRKLEQEVVEGYRERP